ncbi:hypothetical protein TNCV_4532111 [Trichonephila clavipes]|nr:hypothetical protein TNCV_4532111 [Trichonephila clavipes]
MQQGDCQGSSFNCDRVGHSNADTNGRRIVGPVNTNPMCWRCQLVTTVHAVRSSPIAIGVSTPEKLTVWCALWAGGIIGRTSSKNDEVHNVTVNGDRYRAMITNFFIPELNNHDVQELWFQQDGATCHTARATIYLLKDTFGDRLISRFGIGLQDLVI